MARHEDVLLQKFATALAASPAAEPGPGAEPGPAAEPCPCAPAPPPPPGFVGAKWTMVAVSFAQNLGTAQEK